MKYYTQFNLNFLKHYNYPSEAQILFKNVLYCLDNNKFYSKYMDNLHRQFKSNAGFSKSIQHKLDTLAKLMKQSKYTLYFVFYLSMTQGLYQNYLLYGVDEEYFYNSMDDLRCKIFECKEVKGVYGTFVPNWFGRYFTMGRIGYGRFVYEVETYKGQENIVLSSGHVVQPGDIYINFHIPSSGIPLSDEVRLSSYKIAYDHIHQLFDDGRVLFGCESWLLYPKHKEFLPSDMNMLKFLDDFEIVEFEEDRLFRDKWRVFGKHAHLPDHMLPTDTKLRQAYVKWLTDGNFAGTAFGLFLFDGEKIIK